MRFLALAALLVGSTCQAGDPVSASVRIDCPQGGGVSHHGSGTIVGVEDGRALVLTNRHVCPRDGTIYVTFADGGQAQAAWLGADQSADLAALAIIEPEKLPKPQKVDPCPPAKAIPAPGVVVVQVGYPHTRGPIRRTGAAILRGAWRLVTGAPVEHFSLATEQGDSGSGVFSNGELVAVVWGGAGGTCSAVALEDVCRVCSTGRAAKLFPKLAARCKDCPCGPVGRWVEDTESPDYRVWMEGKAAKGRLVISGSGTLWKFPAWPTVRKLLGVAG